MIGIKTGAGSRWSHLVFAGEASWARGGLAVLLLAIMAVVPVSGLPRPKERWLRLDSGNFTVFSNAGALTTRRIVGDLESLRATLSALSPDTELASPVPTTIYVFKNDAAFRPYKPLYNGRPANFAGYFRSHQLGNYVAVDGNPAGEPQRLVYHEYLHEILRNNHPAMPLWLNEGMAELYSTFEVAAGVAKIGLPIRSHLAELSGQRLMSLDQLRAIRRDDRDYNEGTRQGLFYAQSWAIAHYLLIGNADRQRQTKSFLEALHEDVPEAEAFARAFPGGAASLIREVEIYVRGYQLPVLAAKVSWEIDTEVMISELTRAETLFRLGDLLAHGDASQMPAARAHLEAAMAEAPNHAGTQARLALLDQRAGNDAAALAGFRRAATLAPDDPSIQYVFGNALLVSLGEGPLTPAKVSATDRARLLEARAALERSVGGRPGYAEAWAQLGFTYTVEAQPPPRAREALEKAFRMLPSRMDIAFNLLLTYTRIGARSEAEYLVDRVLVARADSATLAAAREAILNFDVMAVNKLLDEERFDEALPVLERLHSGTRDRAQRASLARQMADVRGIVEERRFVVAYNDAVSLANEGRFDRAETVLETLLATLTVAKSRDRTEALLTRIRAMRPR